jgi:hypothetical protein
MFPIFFALSSDNIYKYIYMFAYQPDPLKKEDVIAKLVMNTICSREKFRLALVLIHHLR